MYKQRAAALAPLTVGMVRDVVDGSVRLARAADAPVVAEVQLRTWGIVYGPRLPQGAALPLDLETATERWRAAVASPPTARHHLLVAVAGAGPDTPGEVVGFAAIGPSEDDDAMPTVGEIMVLLVSAGHERQGHGSRLLQAAVDTLREDGFTTATTWMFADDAVVEAFLASTGWEPDGAARQLDMGEPVKQRRMHVGL